ncbi:gamma-glutamylcyclotransferase [Noviherbaspirillum cavernae]|uniref:glutathione-specific gamma-glutamylcyclotransferase n=1 Tax=Noviherbaspirillum cavernae TaxID=2320862 RepID=A0A418WVM4_9BURK|nr:gamma-glutamylcyclotransferase [Noviherbaspirillum cavernae]RJF96736.1 gamma-glutamylcyclotransferase [Noviherbaspirillum cavernae]
MTTRRMALTAGLVAQTRSMVEDAGPEPGAHHTDADYDAIAEAILASHAAGEDAWMFAYGSLIWRPEIEFVEERRATAHGWHRSFCFKVFRHRGTLERPGLMMALDRGGQCTGVLYRLPAATLREQLGKLFRREFTVKPVNSMPRWIKVATAQGTLPAIAFVMNRQSPAYVGRMTLEAKVDILAQACGHWGSCAEYLYNTVSHLEERGIHDRYLWRLQQLVAERLAGATSEDPARHELPATTIE